MTQVFQCGDRQFEKNTYSKTGSKQNNKIIITNLGIWNVIETIEL